MRRARLASRYRTTDRRATLGVSFSTHTIYERLPVTTAAPRTRTPLPADAPQVLAGLIIDPAPVPDTCSRVYIPNPFVERVAQLAATIDPDTGKSTEAASATVPDALVGKVCRFLIDAGTAAGCSVRHQREATTPGNTRVVFWAVTKIVRPRKPATTEPATA